MGKFVKGDVVVIPFPFSDLTGTKRRPALVIKDLPGNDIILCQITSSTRLDNFAIPLKNDDFISGTLSIDSFVRPNKIFTADKNLILYTIGHLSDEKINEITDFLVSLIKSNQ